MPQVTVYIRADDFEKWKALGKKSEFLHAALNKTEIHIDTSPKGSPSLIPSPSVKISTAGREFALPRPPAVFKTCKIHGLKLDSRGRCLQKGCKYS